MGRNKKGKGRPDKAHGPAVAIPPKPTKVPVATQAPVGHAKKPVANPTSYESFRPNWCFGILDMEGPWGWRQAAAHADDILTRLKNFEKMTWADINRDKKHHHTCDVKGMTKDARDRLAALNLDDLEELFRFGCGGKPRIWGQRRNADFLILWWDPEHEVYPSEKKNT